MRSKVLFALACMILSATVKAEEMTTWGVPDCGQWIQLKGAQKDMARAWLLGFVSGLNLAESTKSNALKRTSSPDGIFLWMDNYCKANPTEWVTNGGIGLYLELMKKK